MARKKKDLLEEAVLSVLERIEQNEKEAKELEEQLREAEEKFNHEKAQLETQVNTLNQELSELERQHQEHAQLMDAKILARYSSSKLHERGRRRSGSKWHLFWMPSANSSPADCGSEKG